MIARKALESQLKQIGIFGSDDSISAYPYFDASYKICEYICEVFCSLLLDDGGELGGGE